MKKYWLSLLILSLSVSGIAFAAGHALDAKNVKKNSTLSMQVIKEQIQLKQSDFKSVKLVKCNYRVALTKADAKKFSSKTIQLAECDSRQGTIEVALTQAAAKKLTQLSEANIGKKMDIVWHHRIITVATIQSPLGDRFQITGLSLNSARKFVKAMNSNH